MGAVGYHYKKVTDVMIAAHVVCVKTTISFPSVIIETSCT